MLTKDKLKKAIDTLPNDFTIDDVFEKIIVIYKIEQHSAHLPIINPQSFYHEQIMRFNQRNL